MRNQSAKAAKSSSRSKMQKLLGNLIKSKLSFLMLLTMAAGGIAVGTVSVPELISPAQAFPLLKALTTLDLLGQRVVRIAEDGMGPLKCVTGYGDSSAGVLVNSTKDGHWGKWITMHHGEEKNIWRENGGRYAVQPIDANGNPAGEQIEGVFQKE